VFFPIGIYFLFIEVFFLSEQEFQGASMAYLSAQVKWRCVGLLLLEFDSS
jgi:hypothetical protein